jgi:hypothetical protein
MIHLRSRLQKGEMVREIRMVAGKAKRAKEETEWISLDVNLSTILRKAIHTSVLT